LREHFRHSDVLFRFQRLMSMELVPQQPVRWLPVSVMHMILKRLVFPSLSSTGVLFSSTLFNPSRSFKRAGYRWFYSN
ncbi:hypothetical protein O5560_28320, partial [Escherichia coli]|nr:hypothetical protein [Escherichia coli]